MRLGLILLTVLMFIEPRAGSAQDTAPEVYEHRYLESLSKLVDWIRAADQKVNEWIHSEHRAQLGRRTGRLADRLYALCSSKKSLSIAIQSPQATPEELIDDAEDVRKDAWEVRQSLDRLGADLVAAGYNGPENTISDGLSGKAILMNQVAYELGAGRVDRKRVVDAVENSHKLCRQAQEQAAAIAARLANPDAV